MIAVDLDRTLHAEEDGLESLVVAHGRGNDESIRFLAGVPTALMGPGAMEPLGWPSM